MKEKFRRFMYGRYGSDDLNKFLIIASFAAVIAGIFISSIISWVGIALMVYTYFRMFSRNTAKRSQENYAYLRFTRGIKTWFSRHKTKFSERKTHRYYKCPACRKSLRVPKGKGKISITCPSCGKKFVKTT